MGVHWDGTGPPPRRAPAVADKGFDPSDHTVFQVQAYLEDNPDQSEFVLERERAGKARTTLIGD